MDMPWHVSMAIDNFQPNNVCPNNTSPNNASPNMPKACPNVMMIFLIGFNWVLMD